ncbi:MAG: fasciclin domain-containing protein [Parvularculaceae bacterium]
MKHTLKSILVTLTAFGMIPIACAEESKIDGPPQPVVEKAMPAAQDEETSTLDDSSPPAADTAILEPDIIDTAASLGTFETWLTALNTTGLDVTLRQEGPFTVLAPTDEAFAKLDSASLEALMLADNVDQLKVVLAYHIIPGKIMAADLTDGQKLATLNGIDVTITLSQGPKANDSFLTQVDVPTSNGVIHVIDAVLIPEKAQN